MIAGGRRRNRLKNVSVSSDRNWGMISAYKMKACWARDGDYKPRQKKPRLNAIG